MKATAPLSMAYIKYWAGMFCVLGHMYPIMFGFKGGKGVLSGGTLVWMIDWRIGLVAWAGFRTAEVEFSVAERTVGDTHWSTASLFRYAISNIAAYSSAPMQIVTVLGVLTLLLSLVLGVQTLVNWACGGAADGFTTVIILMLLIGSILMISLGIIGYYIAQIFIEVKARPRYLVARACGQERNGQV